MSVESSKRMAKLPGERKLPADAAWIQGYWHAGRGSPAMTTRVLPASAQQLTYVRTLKIARPEISPASSTSHGHERAAAHAHLRVEPPRTYA